MNIEELIERRCKRLEELSDAITSKDGWESVHREFTMRIPADEDRDADLVLYWAAKTIREQQAEINELKAKAAKWVIRAGLNQAEINSLKEQLNRFKTP